jgi:hypothetical protein
VAALGALVVVALVAALGLASGAAATGPLPPGTGPQGRVPQFKVECGYSHSALDDPIVWPGRPGASHRHDFFGSTAVDADSDGADLLGTDTTCQQRLDTASYWAPSLFVDGAPVEPLGGSAYYRPAPGVDPTTLEPYPTGLALIAGDMHATEAQDTGVVAWHCGASPDLRTEPPTCPASAPLGLRTTFPDCWDGERLSSPDHHAHAAYSERGRCPSSHPVALPQLVFDIHYPVHGEVGELHLASGDPVTAHADFLNGWDPDKLAREVDLCLRGGRVCGVVSSRATG